MATISGQWQWDMHPAAPSELLVQEVAFATLDGYSYTAVVCRELDGEVQVCYDDVSLVVYSSASGWGYQEDRSIDFGEAGQEVSDAFYAYFTANATSLSPAPTVTRHRLYAKMQDGTSRLSVRAEQNTRLYLKVPQA